MLLSMTGFGEAHHQEGTFRVGVEIRTVNSRYFKLSLRCPEGFGSLEPPIEQILRSRIRRGTAQVQLSVQRERRAEDYHLNLDVLTAYYQQMMAVRRQLHDAEGISLTALLPLPGVVTEEFAAWTDADEAWPVIERCLVEACDHLSAMRHEEGRVMARDMGENCRQILSELVSVEARAPVVVANYRDRLTERLKKTLAELDVALNAADIIREVSIFAERSDISEEIVRLRSHVDQFQTIMENDDSAGRRLEFVTQEMFREANTIGSKSNDVELSRHVVEIKASIERIREMIQNVE
jgi:uncharacterized protein (TIGR00255 family)